MVVKEDGEALQVEFSAGISLMELLYSQGEVGEGSQESKGEGSYWRMLVSSRRRRGRLAGMPPSPNFLFPYRPPQRRKEVGSETEYNHSRLLRSRGPAAADGLADFCFEAIPDGLPHSEDDATQDIPALSDAVIKNFLAPFRSLLACLNRRHPPVSCIVSDAGMTFTLEAARELSVPEILFWPASACGYLAFHHYQHLIDRGLVPLRGCFAFHCQRIGE